VAARELCLEGRHILDDHLSVAGLVKTSGILNIVGEYVSGNRVPLLRGNRLPSLDVPFIEFPSCSVCHVCGSSISIAVTPIHER
jgi:hypothetical protein